MTPKQTDLLETIASELADANRIELAYFVRGFVAGVIGKDASDPRKGEDYYPDWIAGRIASGAGQNLRLLRAILSAGASVAVIVAFFVELDAFHNA